MKGQVVPDGEFISPGLFLRINELGFEQLTAVMTPIINDILDTVPQMIYALNPIFDEKVKVWGITVASARASVTNMTLGEPWFTIDVAEDLGITLSAAVNDIHMEFKVKGTILGIGYSISGDIDMAQVRLDADANIFVDEFDRFHVEITNIQMSIFGFNFDINNFPDDLEDLFQDDVRDLIEDTINDILSEEIPPLLEDLLSQLPTDFGFDVSGHPFLVEYTIDNTVWDRDGGTFEMSARISSPDENPAVPDFGGSLATLSEPPDNIGAYVPDSEDVYGFGAIVSDDFINQALYVLFRTGVISADFNAIAHTSDALMQLIFPGLNDTLPGDIDVKLRPNYPPILLVSPPAAADISAVPVEIQFGDLIVNFYVDDGDETLFLRLAVNLIIPAELTVDYPANTIGITFGDPEMSFYVFAEPVIDFDNALFEDVAPVIADLLLPILSDLLSGIQIPSFDVEGYGLLLFKEAAMGGSLDYLGFFLNLEEVVP
ncbi:MAG: hypothetical protein M5R36_28165 [Deltaproteobacteria bacterium]|nr:hypothetical protein [Deltaproteobacteria bacterium]